jgi:ABC-type antimicrobial peptide transport system ATPase subunit
MKTGGDRERLLLVDPPTDSISTTRNQRVLRAVGALCHHNLMQNHTILLYAEVVLQEIT